MQRRVNPNGDKNDAHAASHEECILFFFNLDEPTCVKRVGRATHAGRGIPSARKLPAHRIAQQLRTDLSAQGSVHVIIIGGQTRSTPRVSVTTLSE